jgi:putative serine protease PepD
VALVAGLTALVVGGAAGFGGARLADRTEAAEPGIGATNATPAPAPIPASPGPSTSAPAPTGSGRLDTVAVAKAVLPGSVMIRAVAGSEGSTGSGFVLDSEGHIVTNNHVIADAADGGRFQVVFSDGSRTMATLVGRSPSYDLAVIKVKRSGLEPLRLGDSDASQVGEGVIAVGSPLGLPGTVTEGIVSAKNRPVVVNGGEDVDAPTAYIDGIQTDAPINPGNSGGPLIDASARVIGVNSAILTLGESRTASGNIGLGFAIPINQVAQIAKLLIADGKATYPVIGARVRSSDTTTGVELTSVEARGPADRAGLAEGDMVTKIDGRRVDTIEELIVAIRTRRPGEVVTLEYRRGNRTDKAKVTLGGKEG